MYLCVTITVGLDHEGLYRIAGLHDEVETIRMEFDKGIFYIHC